LEFLSDDQVAAYGRFAGPPERTELERFFFLDDADRALLARRRGDHNRLGFSLQLGTVRFIGMFLADPLDVPAVVVDYLAGQLGVADASSVKRYAKRQSTQWEHAAEIRQVYGYQDASRDKVTAAVAAVEELAPFGEDDDDDADRRAELIKRYATVRPFLPMLPAVIPFGATAAGAPILAAARSLPDLAGRKRVRPGEVDGSLVTGSALEEQRNGQSR
jgi:hypothetical protein